VTDAEGHYRLGGIERDHEVHILISGDEKQPYIPMTVKLPKAEGVKPISIDVDLYKGVWVTGRVTDQSTKAGVPMSVNYLPLASNQFAAKVPVFRQGWAQPPCNTQTNADGTYRLIASPGPGVVAFHPPTASYPLGQGFDKLKSKDRMGNAATLLPGMVSPSWYTAAREIDADPDAVTEGVDFALDAGGCIHFTCTDPEGKAPGKVLVQGNKSGTGDSSETPFDSAEFDAIGFRTDENRMIIIKNPEHHLAAMQTVKLADAKDGKFTIRLQPAGYITGRLLNTQHDPIKGGMVRVDTYIPELKHSNRMDVAVLRSEPDGRFKLELPPDTALGILASTSPYGGRFKEVVLGIKVEPGQTKDLGDIELSEEMMK